MADVEVSTPYFAGAIAVPRGPLRADVQFAQILCEEPGPLPKGWRVLKRWYVQDDQGRALFWHPATLRSAFDSNGVALEEVSELALGGDINPAPQVLSGLKQHFGRWIAEMMEDTFCGPDNIERANVAHKQFKKIKTALNLAAQLEKTGDVEHASSCKHKAQLLMCTSIEQANRSVACKKMAEAVGDFKVAALLYLSLGHKFFVYAGQLLERAAECLFILKEYTEGLRLCEHALLLFVGSEAEVAWAYVDALNRMGKFYSALELPNVAISHYIQSAEMSQKFFGPQSTDSQERVAADFKDGLLLEMPRIDSVFRASQAVSIGLSFYSLGEGRKAVGSFDKAFAMLVASGDPARGRDAFAQMAEVCYKYGDYHHCRKFATAAFEISQTTDNLHHRALDVMFMAHGQRMLGQHREALELFELYFSFPKKHHSSINAGANRLMLAECLQDEKKTVEALQTLRGALPVLVRDQDVVWCNLLMASCYAEMRNFREARSCLHVAHRTTTPPFLVEKRDAVEKQVEGLARDMEDVATRAGHELCPDLLVSRPNRRARKQTKAAAAHAVQGEKAGGEELECCVCLSAQIACAFSPCFHMCVCEACGTGIMATKKECPICCSESQSVHEIGYDDLTCRVCLRGQKQMAFAPCFHLQVCEECSKPMSRALYDKSLPPLKCSTCRVECQGMHRVFY